MTFIGRTCELWRYPVASLRGQSVTQAVLDGHGVASDRLWGLVDAETGSIASPDSERRWRFTPEIKSRMALSGPEISIDGGVWLPLPSAAADAAATKRAGFAVAFKPLAQTATEATPDLAAPRYDRGHLHILTTTSLETLSGLIAPEAKVDVRRFRPNIVIELDATGSGFPDRSLIGTTLAIGDARIEITEPCERCSFIALAQGDLPFAKDVLHAVARHGGGGFGVLGRVATPGTMSVGDAVRSI